MTRLLLAAVCSMLVLAACERQQADPNKGEVSGEVFYLQRIALPDDAVLTVQLEDVSATEAQPVVLAEQRVELQGRQVPVPFQLNYDRRQLQEEHRYAVAARIEDSRGLRFITTELHGVSLADPTVDIEVQVDPVVTGAQADGGPAFTCSGNEPFWNFKLAGHQMDFKRLHDEIRETHYEGGYTALFGPDGGAFYEWVGQDGQGSQIKARVLPGHCDDSMAGPEEGGVFDYSVGITRDGENLAGCCRMLDKLTSQTADEYRCQDGTELSVIYEEVGNNAHLRVTVNEERELILSQEISASGARYSDDGMVFWNKGEQAMLEMGGNEAVSCDLVLE